MNPDVKFTLEDCDVYIGPVTALEFEKTGNLYAGEGPYLKIYETTYGRLVTKERVFDNQRVHSIKLYDSNFGTQVIICGGRIVSVLNVQNNESSSNIQATNKVSFNDWIWDVCLLQGTTETECQCVAVVTGHNAVWLWNFNENKKWQVSQCEEQCILYCARFIGRTLDHMWLACGTVFNEVLLWKVTDKQDGDGKVSLRTRLTGHDGVIFSVRYNQERGLLCSVSDDRSIKIWKAVFTDEYSNLVVSPEPLLTLYGHKARVWDCLILKQHIVSIGEDSLCLLWNSDGKIIRSWKGHIGKSIWSLACRSDEHVIATGGGDSAIRLWLIESETENTKEEQHLVSSIPTQQEITSEIEEEIPRMIGLLYDTSVLVMTDKGNLYRFQWYKYRNECDAPGKWSLLRHEPEYSSYSIMALSNCRTIVALGNISGNIKLVSLTDSAWCSLESKPYTDKVLSLHWEEGDHENFFSLFSCGPEGLVIWWTVGCLKTSQSFSCKVKASFRLPYCRQRWPNSVYLVTHDIISTARNASLVLCGDRRGSLHVFKAVAEKEPVDPVQSLIGIHGRNGVTSICSNSGYIYTTGRDGYIRQYKLSGENLELLDKKKVYKGMEWIDRVHFTSDGEILVFGFHTIDFIIWSMTRNEVLFRIPCGGGHRNWDILYTTTDDGLVFTYLKQSTIHVHTWSEAKKQSPSIIQESFHGRETNCVCFLGTLERRETENQFYLLATGSEDTTINIMIYKPTKINEQRFYKVTSCEGHISSVRCLAFINVSPRVVQNSRSHKHLLFSGGSRASLKCWSLDVDTVLENEINGKFSNLNTSLNSSCTLLAELRSLSHRSQKKKRLGSYNDDDFTCDIRFMSLSAFPITDLVRSVGTAVVVSPPVVGVIAGCSDGYLRFYVFDYEVKNFTILHQAKTMNERCILSVGHFFHNVSTQPRLVMYASDTAGYISFWDVTQLYIEHFLRQRKDFDNTNILEEGFDSMSTGELCVLGDTRLEMGNDLSLSSNFASQNCKVDDKIKSAKDFTQPFYSYKLHQSGVNSISLTAKENDTYLLCSGGDDGAVAFASFQIHTVNDEVNMCFWSMVTSPNAHTSAATGAKFLDDNTAVSASIDQRLKLWKIDWKDEMTKLSAVTLINTYWLDVVDIQDIDVKRDGNGLYYIVASGVGLQLLAVKYVGS